MARIPDRGDGSFFGFFWCEKGHRFVSFGI
jgi:hypothetical protein